MNCPFCNRNIIGRREMVDVVFQMHLNQMCRRPPHGSKAAGPRRFITVDKARTIRELFKL